LSWKQRNFLLSFKFISVFVTQEGLEVDVFLFAIDIDCKEGQVAALHDETLKNLELCVTLVLVDAHALPSFRFDSFCQLVGRLILLALVVTHVDLVE